MGRTVCCLAVGLTAVLLSACAAVTKPATHVGPTSATLNARGHSNRTPAHYEFQYGISEEALGTGFGKQTLTRGPVPPHTAAAFAEPVSGLSTGTTYFFRVCGGDGNVHPDVCDSTRSFTTTVPGATIAFAPPALYSTGTGPVVIANLQAAASRDVVMANASTNDVSVLLNHGDGVYAPAVDYPTAAGPRAIVAANFTGAGRRDIVTASTASSVSVLLGNGHGGLSPAINIALPAAPQSVVVGDFNGDGHQDIATFEDLPRNTSDPNDPYGDTSPGVVSVLLGRGNGSFGAPINTTVIPAAPCGVHGVCPMASDVTLAAGALHAASNRSDLVLAGTLTSHDAFVGIDEADAFHYELTANVDGTFTVNRLPFPNPLPSQQTSLFNGISAVALGDLNGDGRLDEAYIRLDTVINNTGTGITGYTAPTIQVALGNGDGTFAAPSTAASLPRSPAEPPNPGTLRIAAISSHGRPDLVSQTPDGGGLMVTPNNGIGSFGTPVPVDGSVVSVAAADVNHDGKVDLVTDGVYVLDNATGGG